MTTLDAGDCDVDAEVEKRRLAPIATSEPSHTDDFSLFLADLHRQQEAQEFFEPHVPLQYYSSQQTPDAAVRRLGSSGVGPSRPSSALMPLETTEEAGVIKQRLPIHASRDTQHENPLVSPHHHHEPLSYAAIYARRRFMLHMAWALHAYGCATHRTERLISQIASNYQLRVELLAFPGYILISFVESGDDPTRSELRSLKIESKLDCYKLGRVDNLAIRLETSRPPIPLVDAYHELKSIVDAPPLYSLPTVCIFSMLTAFFFTLSLFKGALYDGLEAIVCGLVAFLVMLLARSWPSFARMQLFMTAIAVSCTARLLSAYIPVDVCFTKVTLGGLAWNLPGLGITIAVSEMAARSVTAGVSRLMFSMLAALQLGFGMAIGARLPFWLSVDIPESCLPQPLWVHFLFFFPASVSFSVMMNAAPVQWPGMMIASATGAWTLNFLNWEGWFDTSTSTVIAAFAVGIVGGTISHVAHRINAESLSTNATTTFLAGIIMILPGGLIVRGSYSIHADHQSVSGFSFLSSVLSIALSISIGLLMAQLVMPPRKSGNAHAPTLSESIADFPI